MKRILPIILGLLLTIPALADGFTYFAHCKDFYNVGEYEIAKQGFKICKEFAELNSADMDAWIVKCDNAIAAKRQQALAAAKKAEAERKAAYEDSQRVRKEKQLVYVSSDATDFNGENQGLKHSISRALTNAKYKCVADKDQSLWAVYVTANAREYRYNEDEELYYSYVDVVILIMDEMEGEILFEDEFHQIGGSDKSYAEAARDAYRQANKKVGGIVVNELNSNKI